MVSGIKGYPDEVLAAQPIGYWSGETYRRVVGRIRADLAVEGLTQPHWWILNHVAGAPAEWNRTRLIQRLSPFDDLDSDFDGVVDDLLKRGWMTQTQAGTFSLTEDGEAGRTRAADRSHRALAQVHDGIAPSEYVAALNVLRRMIANLGGDADLP
ncbi:MULTISPECIES: MarR family transcriptional regulator [unclassified Pseudofrankia]|uniref:MarR family transcriptional regulator n=1 Tax=unclassified Pseudofrankia TaxID=2994372 RepID=UPI0008DA0F29|nr:MULTISPECIES: MarR family transcriptional regulator [unclassified Pseudofrankia]MDT3445686.1 MarR family transcriptional regulator [Pseudofrankia sp. BMG5.37]OHV42498.1 hypothetical protein BCD48_31495 [Pseudofrankia sp. BMG5.36]